MLSLFDPEKHWRKFLRNAFPFVLHLKNSTALATEFEWAIKYPRNCLSSIACFPFPVAKVSKVLDKNTNIVAVAVNAKKHIVILEDSFTSWLADPIITILISLTEAIRMHAMIPIERKSIILPKVRTSVTFWITNPIVLIDARSMAKPYTMKIRRRAPREDNTLA